MTYVCVALSQIPNSFVTVLFNFSYAIHPSTKHANSWIDGLLSDCERKYNVLGGLFQKNCNKQL